MKSLKAMGMTGVMVNYIEATRKTELESIASLGHIKAIYNSSGTSRLFVREKDPRANNSQQMPLVSFHQR